MDSFCLNNSTQDSFRVVQSTSSDYSKQLNSTVLGTEDNASDDPREELKYSPILCTDDKRGLINRRLNDCKRRGESPLAKRHLELGSVSSVSIDHQESGYSSRSAVAEDKENSNILSETSSWVVRSSPNSRVSRTEVKRIPNPFEARMLDSLHTTTLSPTIFESSSQPPQESTSFKWTIEEMSLLMPAHITDEEIQMSSCSPDPVKEATIQEGLDIFWSQNRHLCFLPSPDCIRPPPQNESATPSSEMLLRRRAAMCIINSPINRPLRRSFVIKKSRKTQTEVSIPTSMNIDFNALLAGLDPKQGTGDSGIDKEEDEEEVEEEEEVLDVSVLSNTSLRRRLFSADDEQEQPNTSSSNLDIGDEVDKSEVVREDLDGYNGNRPPEPCLSPI